MAQKSKAARRAERERRGTAQVARDSLLATIEERDEVQVGRLIAALRPGDASGLAWVSRVERAAKPKTLSTQSRFTPDGVSGVWAGVYRLVMQPELREPPYAADARTRDRWMRAFVPLESHLEGVLNNVVSVDKNRGWALTGGRNQVATFTKVLHSSNDGAGWREFISQVSAAYYTADVGSVVEIGRQGRNGPLRGLYSVDPTNVRMTGIPEWPLEYFPPDSGMQQWGVSDFFRVVSMPSTDERMRGVGRCAVSRALNLAKLMVAVYLHDEEQLGTRAPKGILVGSNISPQQWETAMTARTEMMGSPDEMEARYFGGVAVIVNSGPDKPDLQLVGLSQLPVGFDLKVFTDLLMYGYALAFGYDPREFWLVSGGQLGTALETETQHKKAAGKGGLEFALAFQEKLQMEFRKPWYSSLNSAILAEL